jgi:hypothetical protein
MLGFIQYSILTEVFILTFPSQSNASNRSMLAR